MSMEMQGSALPSSFGAGPERVYVASSWRNPSFLDVCDALSAANIPHYNFREPEPGSEGFSWTQILEQDSVSTDLVPVAEYLRGLCHPQAIRGFAKDLQAMRDCDACVLVLPCGRSAHLELGWFVGQGKETAILLDGPLVKPELMYRMVSYIAPSLMHLLGWLGVPD